VDGEVFLGVEEGNRPSQGDLPPRSSEVVKTTRKEGAVTQAEFEKMLRGVLNEGTAQGQKSWAGTSQATLRSIQHVINLLSQHVIPRLANPSLAPTHETTSLSPFGSAQGGGDDAAIGLQMLARAETEEERREVEASLLEQTDNSRREDEEEASQEREVPDGDA
jgi:hypothetical protein